MAKPKAFNTYLDSQNKLEMLSDEQAGRLYKSLCQYAASGNAPDFADDPLLQYAFVDFSAQIDRDFEKYESTVEKRREAAKSRWNAEEQCETHIENANGCTCINDDANGCTCINENANGCKRCQEEEKEEEKEEKERSKEKEDKEEVKEEEYREKEYIKKEKCGVFKNVCLTETEIEKLKERFSDYRDRIERLSEYLASTGKRYKSHYAVILTWARKDKEARPPNKRGSMYSADGASFDVRRYEESGLFND